MVPFDVQVEETYCSDFLQHSTRLQASKGRSLLNLMPLPHPVYEITLQPEYNIDLQSCFCCLQTTGGTSLKTLELGTILVDGVRPARGAVKRC